MIKHTIILALDKLVPLLLRCKLDRDYEKVFYVTFFDLLHRSVRQMQRNRRIFSEANCLPAIYFNNAIKIVIICFPRLARCNIDDNGNILILNEQLDTEL